MQLNNLIINHDNGIGYITINRPDKLNALNKATILQLHEAFKYYDENELIRVIILTGKGDKAFAAGADIREFSDYNSAQAAKLSKDGQNLLFNYIENLSTPVIAAINGFALGGGLELAMSCHIRICSSNARLGLPEVSLGVIPGYGGTQRLTQLIGKGRALELITSAQMIDANKSDVWGLVNRVKPHDELISYCISLAEKINQNGPLAIASAIKAINSSCKGDVNGFEIETTEFAKCFETQDFKEGVSAFFEKRKAKFEGL